MDSSSLFLSSSDSSVQAQAQQEQRQGAVILKGHATEQRQPVHMVFLVDISDSMSEHRKLAIVKQSLEFIVPLLLGTDLVSLITFGNQAQVLLKHVPASEQIPILNKVRTLQTDGYTNMSGALMCISDCLEGLNPTGHKTGVLLLTDGHANKGVTDLTGLQTIVRRLTSMHPSLTLTSIGYGHDHQTELLRDMATTGGGSYNVVYTLESVATTFGEVLGGLTTVVAQNVELHFPAGCELQTGHSVRESNSSGEGSKIVRIGDVYADNEIVILFQGPVDTEIRVTGHDMLTLSRISTTLRPSSSSSPTIPKSVELASFRYEVSQLLRESTHSRSTQSNLRDKAESLLARLRTLPYVEEQLVQMMIDDIERLLETIDMYGDYRPQHITTNIEQHSAYLAMGRGLRSQIPDEYEDDLHASPLSRQSAVGTGTGTGASSLSYSQDQDQTQETPQQTPLIQRTRTAHVDTMSSPFSNPTQRRVTQTLRSMSSQQ